MISIGEIKTYSNAKRRAFYLMINSLHVLELITKNTLLFL
jgi:hypothetical protein